MNLNISQDSIEKDLRKIGLKEGDVVLVRASLGAVGRINRKKFLQALLNVVGENGTIMSLSFTSSCLLWQMSNFPPFTKITPSYAGPLPNTMLEHAGARRSEHPQCSFVAIGKYAEFLTADHGPNSGAYEPIRKLIKQHGKMMLVGCVSGSPGFTTTHLAEVDLGLHRRVIAPWLFVTPFISKDGVIKTFYRKDPGLCSASFWKFYSAYVRQGVLNANFIGHAYSIIADASECYAIEKAILTINPKFNICESPDCIACNLQRWDRVHHWPILLIRRMLGMHRGSK